MGHAVANGGRGRWCATVRLEGEPKRYGRVGGGGRGRGRPRLRRHRHAGELEQNSWREVGWSAGSLRLTISAAAPRSPRMSVVAKDGCPCPTQPSRSVPTCSVTFASSPLRNARDSPLPVERKEQNYGKSTQTQHRLRPRPLGRRLLLQQTHPDPSGRGTCGDRISARTRFARRGC